MARKKDQSASAHFSMGIKDVIITMVMVCIDHMREADFFVPVVLLFLLQMVFHLLFKRSILSTLYYRFLSRSLDTKKERKGER